MRKWVYRCCSAASSISLTIGYKFLPATGNSGEVGSVGEQRDYSDVPRWKQILSLVVLIVTILGMIFLRNRPALA